MRENTHLSGAIRLHKHSCAHAELKPLNFFEEEGKIKKLITIYRRASVLLIARRPRQSYKENIMKINRVIMAIGLICLLMYVQPVNAGMVVAWGDNYDGEVSNAPTGTGFTAIAAGWDTGYALTPEPCTLLLLCLGALINLKRFPRL
jgi:hypothetical protein